MWFAIVPLFGPVTIAVPEYSWEMGGYGYSSEYDMERLVRTALVSTIYGGTSEIQREIIAKTYGL